MFKYFEDLCCRAYNILRQHRDLLLSLFVLMIPCGMPELQKEADVSWLRDKLLPRASEEEAAAHFRGRIVSALTAWSTRFNDACHILKKGTG